MAVDIPIEQLPELPEPGPCQTEIRFRRLLLHCTARAREERASDAPGAAAPWQSDPKFHCVSGARCPSAPQLSPPPPCAQRSAASHPRQGRGRARRSASQCRPPADMSPKRTHKPQFVEALRELLYDLESSPADAPGPDVIAAYQAHVAWFGRELRPPEVRSGGARATQAPVSEGLGGLEACPHSCRSRQRRRLRSAVDTCLRILAAPVA